MEAMAELRSTESAAMLRDDKRSFELLKVGYGPFVGLVKKNVVAGKEKEGGKGVVFSLYAGHDITLLPLLAVLESLDMRWPPYVSFFFLLSFSMLHLFYVMYVGSSFLFTQQTLHSHL